MEKIKVCITGHQGFIGKHLKEKLVKNNKLSLIFFNGDLLDRKKVGAFFEKNKDIDQIIHLVGRFFGSFEELSQTNVIATYNLLESISAGSNIKKIIYASSGAVYGEPIGKDSIETDFLKPNTLYGLTKAYAEECIKYFSDNFGLHFVILRFPNVYGEGNTRGVVHNFLTDIKSKGEITVYGDGTQSRNFLHVSDACQAIEKSVFYNKSNIFNISNPHKVTIKDIIKILGSRYKFKVNYQKANNNLKDLLLNPEKAKKELKFVSRVTELEI